MKLRENVLNVLISLVSLLKLLVSLNSELTVKITWRLTDRIDHVYPAFHICYGIEGKNSRTWYGFTFADKKTVRSFFPHDVGLTRKLYAEVGETEVVMTGSCGIISVAEE